MADTNDPVVTKSMLDTAVEDIAGIIRDFSTRVDERFNKVEADIADLNAKYDHLITTLDGFIKRLDDQEQENAARDAHLERLDRWVRQVAERLQMELR